MGKRSDFVRRKNDLYETWDARAVTPLLPHLMPGTRFAEPCAGGAKLIDQLEAAGHVCTHAYDIEPLHNRIAKLDALVHRPDREAMPFDCFITNPMWTRKLLHPLIEHLSDQAPTWLLFDAEWANTKQAIPYLPRLRRIVSVGRLRWVEGTTMDAMDSCAWYLFGRPGNALPDFVGRRAA